MNYIHFFCGYIKKNIYLCIENNSTMFIEFDKEYLLELFEKGRTSDKKYRFQPR